MNETTAATKYGTMAATMVSIMKFEGAVEEYASLSICQFRTPVNAVNITNANPKPKAVF